MKFVKHFKSSFFTALLECRPGNRVDLYLYLYLNWQNVLGTHHASAHGGSSDLIVKMLD